MNHARLIDQSLSPCAAVAWYSDDELISSEIVTPNSFKWNRKTEQHPHTNLSGEGFN